MSKKWILSFLLVSALLVFLIHLLLQSGVISDKARGVAEKNLERLLGRPIRIEQVQLRSLSASILFKGVSAAPSGAASPFSADEIRVYFSPWSLITQSFFIRQIVIESPSVALTPEFLSDSPFSMKTAAKQGPPPVVIRAIRINNGTFSYRGSGILRAVSMGGVHAEIYPDFRMSRFEIDLASGRGALSTAQGERPIDRAEAKLLLLSGSVEIKQGSLESGKASLRAEGRLHPGEGNRLDLRVEARFPIEEAGIAALAERALAGEAIFQGEITGDASAPALSGKISLPHLLAGGAEIGSLVSDISYRDRTLTIPSLSGELFAGSFSGSAEGALAAEAPRYHASLQYQRLPLEKARRLLFNTESALDRALEGIFIEGALSATGAGMSLADWRGEGHAAAKRLPLFSPPFPSDAGSGIKLMTLLQEGSLHWIWSEGRLRLDQGRIALPKVDAAFQGSWGEQGLLVETKIAAEEIKGVADPLGFPVAGALRMEGVLSGGVNHPHLEGNVLLDRWTLQKKSMGTLASAFAYQDQVLSLKEGRLESPAAVGKAPPYRFDGSFRWTDPERPLFDLKAKVTSADPQTVFQFFKLSIPLQTAASGTLSISGTSKAFTVRGPLSVTRGTLYGERFDRGKLELTVTEKEVFFQKVVLEREKARAEGEGEIDYRGNYRIAAKGSALPIQELQLLRSRAPLLAGEAALEVAGAGSFQKPRLRVTAAIQGLRYGEMEGKSGAVKVDWREDLVQWEGSLAKNLTARGEFRLVASHPFSFQGQFGRLRVDSFLKERLSPPFSKMTLSVTGELQGSGTLAQIDQINLTGKLTEFNADLGGYPVDNDGPIAVRAERGVFTFENARLKGENTALEFNGGLTPLKQWDLFVKGEANLNLFPFFSRTITSGKGKATLDVRIADQWASPRILGELSLEDGTVRTVALPQPVHIATLSVVFNERVLLLEALEGEMGRGRFHANGKADLAGFGIGAFGFLLEISDTRINLLRDLTATLDGELFFQREGTVQTLKGEMSVKKAVYEKRVDLRSAVLEWRQKKEEEAASETPLIGATRLNIRLSGKENIWIDNNVAKAPLEIDLALRGTIDRPMVIGRIEIPRGSIYFRRNEFKITSGAVEFLDPQKIEPRFDFKAKTQIKVPDAETRGQERKYDINLSLTGSLSQFILTLASDPALPEADILSLLTFGKTTAEFAQSQKGGAGSEATNFLLSELLEGPVQKFTGVDRIQVDPYTSGSKSSTGPRLTAEKRLLEDRLLVTYSTTLDPSEEHLIRMIYELGKNVSLVGERDENGRIGGEVRFRFEFR